MKNFKIWLIFTVLVAIFGSPAFGQYDDVYYNPNRDAAVQRNTRPNPRSNTNSNNNNYSNNSNYSTNSNNSYNSNNNGYNSNNNSNYNSNQYANNNSYDYYYTSRLRRFYRPYYGFGFFDPVYVDSYYYDPYLQSGLTVLIYDNPTYYSGWNRWNNYSRYNNYGWGGGFNNYGFGNGFNNYGWGGGYNNYGWGGGFNLGWGGFNNYGYGGGLGYCYPTWGNGFAYSNFNNVYYNNNNYYNNNGSGNGGVARDNNSYYGPRRGGAGIGPDPALTPRPAPGFTDQGGRAEVQRAHDRLQNSDRQALTPNNNNNLRNGIDGSAPGVIQPGMQPGGRNMQPQRQMSPTTDPRSIGNDGVVGNPNNNYDGGRRLPAPTNTYDRSSQNNGLNDGYNNGQQPIDRGQPYNYDRTRQASPSPIDNGTPSRTYTQDRTPNNRSNNGSDFFNDRPRTVTQDRSYNNDRSNYGNNNGGNNGNNGNNNSGGGGFFNDRPRSYAPDRTPSYDRSSGYGGNNNGGNNGGGFNNSPRSSGGGGFGGGNNGGGGGFSAPRASSPAPSSPSPSSGGRRQ